MEVRWNEVDSIIFDMDGTLWDATYSYLQVWTTCSAEFGVSKIIEPYELMEQLGKPIEQIFDALLGSEEGVDKKRYIAHLDELETEMMPSLGGSAYSFMVYGIKALSEKYKLFVLSNCGANGIINFMNYFDITHCFSDFISFGDSSMPKSENLKILIERNKLKTPIYVGDTQGDCDQTRMVGIPFVHAAYGFGTCDKPDLSFNDFRDLYEYFLRIKTV